MRALPLCAAPRPSRTRQRARATVSKTTSSRIRAVRVSTTCACRVYAHVQYYPVTAVVYAPTQAAARRRPAPRRPAAAPPPPPSRCVEPKPIAVSTRILGKTMREAVRNTERWKRRVRLPKILVLRIGVLSAASTRGASAAARRRPHPRSTQNRLAPFAFHATCRARWLPRRLPFFFPFCGAMWCRLAMRVSIFSAA